MKLWHDNEKFINQPKEYKKVGMVSMNFPSNSGDLNPIETVWAKLRRDLAVKEFEDLKVGRVISKKAFKQRVSQLLASYSTQGLRRYVRFFVRRFSAQTTNETNQN